MNLIRRIKITILCYASNKLTLLNIILMFSFLKEKAAQTWPLNSAAFMVIEQKGMMMLMAIRKRREKVNLAFRFIRKTEKSITPRLAARMVCESGWKTITQEWSKPTSPAFIYSTASFIYLTLFFKFMNQERQSE